MPAMNPPQTRNGNGQHTIGNIPQSVDKDAITEKLDFGNLEVGTDSLAGIVDNNEALPSNNNEGLLSLKDIEARTGGDNYSKLMRFANQPGIGELLGAVKVTGAKGVRYQPWAVGVFQRLLAAQEAGAVTQSTAVSWLRANDARPSETPSETSIAEQRSIAEYPKSGNHKFENGLSETGFPGEGMSRGLAMIFGPVVSIMQEVRDLLRGRNALDQNLLNAPPVPDRPVQDRLLTPEQAAGLLACKPRSVGRHVPPISENPRRYRESDVLRHIQDLQPITKPLQK